MDRAADPAQAPKEDTVKPEPRGEHVRFGCDPAGDQPSDDGRVVDHHHPQRLLPYRSRGWGANQRNSHYSPDPAESGIIEAIRRGPFSRRIEKIREGRLP